MDIGGINRIKVTLPASAQTEIKRNNSATAERDSQGHAYEQKPKVTKLSDIQEDEALKSLNALPSFVRLGLKAELVREAGRAVCILVRDRDGQTVRHMSYDQVVDLYLNRHMESETGRLLKRAA